MSRDTIAIGSLLLAIFAWQEFRAWRFEVRQDERLAAFQAGLLETRSDVARDTGAVETLPDLVSDSLTAPPPR